MKSKSERDETVLEKESEGEREKTRGERGEPRPSMTCANAKEQIALREMHQHHVSPAEEEIATVSTTETFP